LLTAVGLPPGGSNTVHIYTQTVHRTIQLISEECGACPVFAICTLAFALQLRKKHGKKNDKQGRKKRKVKVFYSQRYFCYCTKDALFYAKYMIVVLTATGLQH
jgi:hypothetical protein